MSEEPLYPLPGRNVHFRSCLRVPTLTVASVKGTNAGAKVSALVAGMCTRANSIDDMNLLRCRSRDSLFSVAFAVEGRDGEGDRTSQDGEDARGPYRCQR